MSARIPGAIASIAAAGTERSCTIGLSGLATAERLGIRAGMTVSKAPNFSVRVDSTDGHFSGFCSGLGGSQHEEMMRLVVVGDWRSRVSGQGRRTFSRGFLYEMRVNLRQRDAKCLVEGFTSKLARNFFQHSDFL